jgi:transposase
MITGETITISKAEYQEFINLKAEAEKYKSEVEWLKHQLAELRRMLFGQKRERFISPDPAQGVLFDLPVQETTEKQVEEITYTRNKPKKFRRRSETVPLAG